MIVLPTVGTTELIERQNLRQALLGESLLGKNGGHTNGSLFALRRVQQREPLYLVQMALFLAYLMEIARSAEPMNMSKT